jgi:hypothetical protein
MVNCCFAGGHAAVAFVKKDLSNGGMSEWSIPASFMRSTLAKSLLIDFLLTSICLSHGDNPRGIVAAWRVGNDDYSTGERAQSD